MGTIRSFFVLCFCRAYAVEQNKTRNTVQCSTVQCSAVQYSTVQYSTVQYSTVQYSTVQYSNSAVQSIIMWCSAVQNKRECYLHIALTVISCGQDRKMLSSQGWQLCKAWERSETEFVRGFWLEFEGPESL